MPTVPSYVDGLWAYPLIAAHYGDRRATRSQQPLIKHIHEGVLLLQDLQATERAQNAFCLHPLFQGDRDLEQTYRTWQDHCDAWTHDPAAILLVMEYRRVANAYLSHRTITAAADIELSPLGEVNQMLVADKIQNRRDFEAFHRGTHPRSEALERYFHLWFERLAIGEDAYDAACRRLAALPQ